MVKVDSRAAAVADVSRTQSSEGGTGITDAEAAHIINAALNGGAALDSPDIKAAFHGPKELAAYGAALRTIKAGASKTSDVEGKRVGSIDGRDVVVTRESGPRAGVEDRWQAIALARTAGFEPAGAVQDGGGKWHAVQLTEYMSSNMTPADGWQHLNPIASKAEIERLKPGYDEGLEGKKAYAAAVLGVDPSEINICQFMHQSVPGKINLVDEMEISHGSNVVGAHDGGRIMLRPSMLKENPALAQSKMYHETQHLLDHKLADKYTEKYKSSGSKDPMLKWALEQKPADEGVLASDFARNGQGATEARANMGELAVATYAGNIKLARDVIDGYMKEAQPAIGSLPLQTKLFADLKTAYDQLPADKKKEFNEMMRQEAELNPGNWLFAPPSAWAAKRHS